MATAVVNASRCACGRIYEMEAVPRRPYGAPDVLAGAQSSFSLNYRNRWGAEPCTLFGSVPGALVHFPVPGTMSTEGNHRKSASDAPCTLFAEYKHSLSSYAMPFIGT